MNHIHDKVSDLLKIKSRIVWGVAPCATVYEALELISTRDIGAVLVVEDSRLLGVFSEREYARNIALHGRSSHRTHVSEVMLTPPITISPNASIDEAMRLMSDRRIRHLPVMDGAVVTGIISMSDVVKWIIAGQERTIQQLECYIAGRYDTAFASA